MSGHRFDGRIGGRKRGRKQEGGWRYCYRCGLIALNNRVTEKAIKATCPADLDDEPKEQRS